MDKSTNLPEIEDEAWECWCGEMTTVTHWRHGADGALFHAGPDAPPSDPSTPANYEQPK